MRESSPPVELAPKHIRAARALLAWSQQDLAKAAGVATSTVADFERGQRTPVANNAQAIRSALEKEGIRFMPGGAVIGPEIPSTALSAKPAKPVRWVTAQDLSDWADRTDGAVSLPTLISNLIRATHGSTAELRFPSDEGVRHGGWDGRTFVAVGSTYVPQGEAGWEIGSQRSNISQKATEDYRKRTEKPGTIDAPNSTYVFVTPRHWPKKDEWASARREEGVWKDVRVYDANDLVHWLEQTPAIGLWLATRLKKRPEGALQLEDVWEEWSLASKWPLSADLVLCDRDEDAAALHRWLRDRPSVLSLQSTTAEEVMAFAHAAIGMLPDDVKDSYHARMLVVTNAGTARDLASAPGPLILVLSEPEAGLAQSLVKRDHHVLLAYDDRPITQGEVRRLARPSREGISAALVDMGINETRANALARDSARNLGILRRLIPAAPGHDPQWAKGVPPRALLAALLVGGWDDDLQGDRQRFSELAGQPYEEVISTLVSYVGYFDRPLRKLGSTWRVASPLDAWYFLAPHLSSIDIARFEAVAHAVLGSPDPRFGMDPDARWMASAKGVHREYSELMRHGIGEVLILLALWGERAHAAGNTAHRADGIVEALLNGAGEERWWSLSRDFRLLAEASPDAFLTAIEDSLEQENPPIRVLFVADSDSMFGTEHLSDLLWALESLAWSPELMPRVSLLLARLDAMDPGGNYSNRPANSLREIHLLWIPQTFATFAQRIKVLDLLRKTQPQAAWKLMLSILPQGHDTSTPAPKPRWRDFSVDSVETITYGLIGQGAAAIAERLLKDVGENPDRWIQIIDRLDDLVPSPREGIAALERAEQRISDAGSRSLIWKQLRHVLHHHRQFPEAQWAMPEELLGHIEDLYMRFAPADRLEQIAWLFDDRVELIHPSDGWKGEQREADKAKLAAATELYREAGTAGILALARQVQAPGYIGKALYESGLKGKEFDELLERSFRSKDKNELGVAHGATASAARDLGEEWGRALFARAKVGAWGDDALLAILRALPAVRWTWSSANEAGDQVESEYWRSIPEFWLSDAPQDVEFSVQKLVGVGRARDAVALAVRQGKSTMPSSVLIEILRQAVRQPIDDSVDRNGATMFQHYVEELLKVLDDRGDVEETDLVWLEWSYLPLLAHSRRPAKALMRALSNEPELFVEMVSAVYKSSEEGAAEVVMPEDPERARAIATQAYRLLEMWDRIPGYRDDGFIDVDFLEAWIKRARQLAKAAGREDVADSRIGVMLSSSPTGEDGNWPAEPVRHVIDLFRSKPMLSGFWVGKLNRRGVTTRHPRSGGALERDEAANYRRWAQQIAFEHPHTAKVLSAIADSYDRDAGYHDESVERMDWE